MAETKTAAEFREHFVKLVHEWLTAQDPDALRTGTNELAFPFVDKDHNEQWLRISISVPKGSRDGTPFDGYEKAEEYQQKVEEQKRKAEEKQREKEQKIKADKRKRELQKQKQNDKKEV